jgi:lipid-A-disaccharide synthase-like uncharacterized protein
MSIIGYIGLGAIAVCWVPQSLETIRAGRCSVNLLFLILTVLGSICLTLYAIEKADMVFSVLNTLTALGGLINLYYKLFPRPVPPLEHSAPGPLPRREPL